MDVKKILIEQSKLFNDTSNEIAQKIINDKIIVYDNFTNINFDDIRCIELEKITWIYDINNYRIPYVNEKKITAIKLGNENIFNYISSSSIINNENIICGENLQFLADIVIASQYKIKCNPNNHMFSKKICNIDNMTIQELNIYKNIFVPTDDLLTFHNKFCNSVSFANKNIISHNSDHEIDNQYINFLNNVGMQLSQNCLIRHEKLISLPIGIENRQWFNHDIFHKVRKMNIPKIKDVYFLFSLNTHPTRNLCYNALINKLEWNNKLSKEDYFIELKKHKYAICPRGNGLDTHRIWECLYLDVIPVMIAKDFINIENLPIIIFDNWNQFEKYKLHNNFSNLKMEKITLEYYKKILS